MLAWKDESSLHNTSTWVSILQQPWVQRSMEYSESSQACSQPVVRAGLSKAEPEHSWDVCVWDNPQLQGQAPVWGMDFSISKLESILPSSPGGQNPPAEDASCWAPWRRGEGKQDLNVLPSFLQMNPNHLPSQAWITVKMSRSTQKSFIPPGLAKPPECSCGSISVQLPSRRFHSPEPVGLVLLQLPAQPARS